MNNQLRNVGNLFKQVNRNWAALRTSPIAYYSSSANVKKHIDNEQEENGKFPVHSSSSVGKQMDPQEESNVSFINKPTSDFPPPLQFNFDDIQVRTKRRTMKPQRPPFAKNLFLGVFDSEILTYPEALDNEEMTFLTNSLLPVQNYFGEMKGTESFQQLRQDLVNLQLFGFQGPQNLGGRQLTITETCKFYEEMAKHPSVANTAINHQSVGAKILMDRGSKTLQDKYLKDVLTGLVVTTWGVAESENADIQNLITKAKLSEDKKYLVLNGHKSYIVNGLADLIFLLVKTVTMNPKGFTEEKLSCLLVDLRGSHGSKVELCEPLGFKESNIAHISFKDTPVPLENIIGEVGQGLEIFHSSLTRMRLNLAPLCITMTKDMLNRVTEYSLITPKPAQPMSQMEAIRFKISEIASSLYAMESMTYLTTGLIDIYENQDCEMESAIVKVFSSDACLSSAGKVLQLYGSAGYRKEHWASSIYENALDLTLSNENNDSLKLVIALMGLQHAGITLQDEIRKLRNPFFYPLVGMKKMWEQRRQESDNPNMNLHLADYIHHSAANAVQFLEYSVLRLQYATEMFLIYEGNEVLNKHMDLRRLADCIIDIYAMTAVIGRSSRSYCIGLRNADYEMLLSHTFCLSAVDRVKANISHILLGQYKTNDVTYNKMSDRIYKHKGNFTEHPLAKNY